jgi:hypothetical protein
MYPIHRFAARVLCICLFAVLAHSAGVAQAPPKGFLQEGEVLQYRVKWNFFRLGTITIRTLRDTSSSDSSLFRLQMVVESNPDLAFVSIREFNESLVQSTALRSIRFRAEHRNGDDVREIVYAYDSAAHTMRYVETDGASGRVAAAETLRNVPPYVEGASLFFFARSIAGCGCVKEVPTMVGGKLAPTRLDFSGPAEDVDVDGLDHPVRARKFSGRAEWTGGTSAGLSGSFEGWMSDDDAAIPVKAELEVLLGSVTLELERWHHPGWMDSTLMHAANVQN